MLTDEHTAASAKHSHKSEIVRLLTPEPGELLDGRFLILELLNQGGTSRVLKATDLDGGELVAIKVPQEHFAQDPEFLERFRREEEIGLRARHPYLVAARHVPEKSRPYIVTDYVKGETLARRLASGRKPSDSEAARIAVMILGALEELHFHGIVHRDVTPQNVMLCEDGTARLMDYGIADTRKKGGTEEWIWGTPAYMAPEQVRNEPGDARTDVYGLGVVLYEMLTGGAPFVGDDPIEVMNARLSEAPVAPRTLRPDISPELERVVLRALEKDPKHRYHDARSMRDDLEPFVFEDLRRPAPPMRPRKWKEWFTGYWTEVAVIGLLGALVVKAGLSLGGMSS